MFSSFLPHVFVALFFIVWLMLCLSCQVQLQRDCRSNFVIFSLLLCDLCLPVFFFVAAKFFAFIGLTFCYFATNLGNQTAFTTRFLVLQTMRN